MPNLEVTTETKTTTAQRVAMLFVVAVGIVVLGSVAFAGAYTWTMRKSTTTAKAPVIVAPQQQAQVAGESDTFGTELIVNISGQE
jgi:flagellar basal body-associated protein FliL